jgi:uncharacterized protein YbjT (DUF2867 family)
VALRGLAEVEEVTALVRRPLGVADQRKLREQVVDVTTHSSYAAFLQGHDAAICTLGVGQPSKVSREEFTRIDHDAVLAFARACKLAGVKHFSLLGSVAADAGASNFYLKSKGALRDAIAALGFEHFSVFQPSMLMTPQNRYGFSQAMLLAVWPVVSTLMIGPLAKYRGVRVEQLGAAMARNLLTAGKGVEILHWPEFQRLAS